MKQIIPRIVILLATTTCWIQLSNVDCLKMMAVINVIQPSSHNKTARSVSSSSPLSSSSSSSSSSISYPSPSTTATITTTTTKSSSSSSTLPPPIIRDRKLARNSSFSASPSISASPSSSSSFSSLSPNVIRDRTLHKSGAIPKPKNPIDPKRRNVFNHQQHPNQRKQPKPKQQQHQQQRIPSLQSPKMIAKVPPFGSNNHRNHNQNVHSHLSIDPNVDYKRKFVFEPTEDDDGYDYETQSSNHNGINQNILEPNKQFIQEIKNGKKTDVSVTVYHHRAIQDPVYERNKRKFKNFYGNGYGLHYGYDLDGKYAREKGYKFEKALGQETCQDRRFCGKELQPTLETPDTALKKHILSLIRHSNEVDLDSLLTKQKMSVKYLHEKPLKPPNTGPVVNSQNVFMGPSMPALANQRQSRYQPSPSQSPSAASSLNTVKKNRTRPIEYVPYYYPSSSLSSSMADQKNRPTSDHHVDNFGTETIGVDIDDHGGNTKDVLTLFKMTSSNIHDIPPVLKQTPMKQSSNPILAIPTPFQKDVGNKDQRTRLKPSKPKPKPTAPTTKPKGQRTEVRKPISTWKWKNDFAQESSETTTNRKNVKLNNYRKPMYISNEKVHNHWFIKPNLGVEHHDDHRKQWNNNEIDLLSSNHFKKSIIQPNENPYSKKFTMIEDDHFFD